MTKDAWFPLFHRDFRGGTRKLTLEERGAYMELLMLMYDARGSIEDDEAGIAAELGCDKRVWRRIRQRLLDAGKIEIEGGRLINARARREIENQLRLSEQRTIAGAEGGRKSGESRRRKSDAGTTSGELPADFSRTSGGSSAEVSRTCDAKPLKNRETGEASASIPQAQSQDTSSLRSEVSNPSTLGAGARAGEKPPDPPERPPDRNQVFARCVAAAGPGLADPSKEQGLHLTAPRLFAALAAGCDLDADILPVIAKRTANPRASPITTWAYFEGAWIDARDKRLAQLPPPDPTRFAGEITHGPTRQAQPARTTADQIREERYASWGRVLSEFEGVEGVGAPALAARA